MNNENDSKEPSSTSNTSNTSSTESQNPSKPLTLREEQALQNAIRQQQAQMQAIGNLMSWCATTFGFQGILTAADSCLQLAINAFNHGGNEAAKELQERAKRALEELRGETKVKVAPAIPISISRGGKAPR